MNTAIKKEISKKYMEATKSYEEELFNKNSIASVDSYINLAFLYWGFAFLFRVPEDVPEDYSIIGGERYQKVLESGLDKYPKNVELNFWKRYFSHIIFGEEFSKNDCEQLITKFGDINSKVPYFFLYQYDKEKYKQQRAELIDECDKLPTAKNLYIKSILK